MLHTIAGVPRMCALYGCMHKSTTETSWIFFWQNPNAQKLFFPSPLGVKNAFESWDLDWVCTCKSLRFVSPNTTNVKNDEYKWVMGVKSKDARPVRNQGWDEVSQVPEGWVGEFLNLTRCMGSPELWAVCALSRSGHGTLLNSTMLEGKNNFQDVQS